MTRSMRVLYRLHRRKTDIVPKQQQSKRYRDLERGRNPHLAERLRERPNGMHDPRPRRERTRAARKQAALKDYR